MFLPRLVKFDKCASLNGLNLILNPITAHLCIEVSAKRLFFFFSVLMPQKLECEKLMILETTFNLLNTNKDEALNRKPVISLQSDWDWRQRSTEGDPLWCKSQSVYVRHT